MGLLNYFLNQRSKRLLKQAEQHPSLESDYAFCEKLIRAVNIDYFQQYDPQKGGVVHIQTGVIHLDIMLRVLKRVVATLKLNQTVGPSWYMDQLAMYENEVNGIGAYRYVVKPMTVDRILIMSSGYYGDPTLMIADFLYQSLNVCAGLNEDAPITEDYRLVMTQSLNVLMRDIVQITLGVMRVSI